MIGVDKEAIAPEVKGRRRLLKRTKRRRKQKQGNLPNQVLAYAADSNTDCLGAEAAAQFVTFHKANANYRNDSSDGSDSDPCGGEQYASSQLVFCSSLERAHAML